MPATGKNAASTPPASAGTPELTITRTFNAPRDLVYRLFTVPEHLVKGDRDGHRGGWNSSFGRFEEFLATVRESAAQ